MKKIIISICLSIILLFSLSLAVEDIEEDEGRLLVESAVSCENLSNSDLEAIGEYYMELTHPGVLHDAMHTMMGLEEGTEEHEQVHISIAKRMYCGEYSYYNGMMGYGMMGFSINSGSYFFWNSMYILFIGLIVALTIFLILWIMTKKRRKKK